MDLQPIYNIAEICSRHGIREAILSPGSRCAPITLAFTRHPNINCRTISDERSAAFIALGITQQIKKPAVLVCTSGSAAFNYAPAVAEAYFQQIPLVVITADRPPELIDQLDGQTIRQTGIYGNHIKRSYDFPVETSHPDAKWHTARIVSEAINLSQEFPAGPVHINIPLREPLYPENNEPITFDEDLKIITKTSATSTLNSSSWQKIVSELESFKKILIVGGQESRHESYSVSLEAILSKLKIPLAGDIISNLHPIQDVIRHADLFLGQGDLNAKLQPDLLITFGKSIISKNLKLLLRKYKPVAHWHIQPAGYTADTFKSLTRVIHADPGIFFDQMMKIDRLQSGDRELQERFYELWQGEEQKTIEKLQNFFPREPLGEFELIKEVIHNLPDHSNLHLANSMAVRYANFIGLRNPTVEVFSNRGTSGIDGSNSTAVGHCFGSEKLNILVTGDMAFFYDRNAFWHNYTIKNLRVVLLNNHAGGIFRIINGPNELPELEEYFETRQRLNGKLTAEEFGFDYVNCSSRSELKENIQSFLEISGGPKILELETTSKDNAAILKDFKLMMEKFNNKS